MPIQIVKWIMCLKSVDLLPAKRGGCLNRGFTKYLNQFAGYVSNTVCVIGACTGQLGGEDILALALFFASSVVLGMMDLFVYMKFLKSKDC